jgi:hypothetical protein
MQDDNNLEPDPAQPLTEDEIPPDLELDFPDVPVAPPPPAKELELAASSNSPAISISHENHNLTAEIEKRVGPPFIGTKGGYSINQTFFAEGFGVSHEIIYDHGSGAYYQYNSKNGCYDRQRADTIRLIITDDIFKRAKERNIHGIGAKITRNLQISIEGMAKELISHNDFFARDPLESPITWPTPCWSLKRTVQCRHFLSVLTIDRVTRSRCSTILEPNDLPWARRLLNVDYRRPRPLEAKIIDNFHEVLPDEAGPGILNWMIKGAKAHWQELKAQRGFAVAPEQRERVENILLRSRSVEVFLKSKVRRKENFNLSVAELYGAYCQFCGFRQWNPLPPRKFEECTHELILEIHGAAKSNDIMRDGKSVKGYRHLTFN